MYDPTSGGIGQLMAPTGNVYDPVTRTYKPAVETPSLALPSVDVGMGPQGSAWGSLSGKEQADFYAANPGFAAVTQAGQSLFGLTSPGMLQGMLAPGFVAEQGAIARGGLSSLAAIDNVGTMAFSPGAIAAMNAGLDIGHSGQGSAETGVSAAGEADAGGPGSGGGADNGGDVGFAYGGLVGAPSIDPATQQLIDQYPRMGAPQGEAARMFSALPQLPPMGTGLIGGKLFS